MPDSRTQKTKCIICQLLDGSEPASFVYRDDRCAAFMDIQPINAGHLLVVPNNHAASLKDLTAESAAHLMAIAHRLAVALRTSRLLCEGVNMFLADGEAAGQEVLHVHLHVFPRYRGDGFGLRIGSDYVKRQREELDEAPGQIRGVLEEDSNAQREVE